MRTILSLLLFVSATYVQAQETVERYAFKALINGKIPVEVAFEGRQNDTDWMTAGYIYYPKAKNPAPILIVNYWGEEKPVNRNINDHIIHSRMVEFQPDGEITGMLYLQHTEYDGFNMKKGSWKNPNNGRVLQLSQFEVLDDMPSWWPGTPAVLTAPKRKDWTVFYKLENQYDETGDNDWMDCINISFEAKGKEMPLKFKEELTQGVTSDMEEKLDWIFEKDINFDGIPDLLVSLYVTHNGSSTYMGYVWNPATRQFYRVPEFENMQEVDIDSKTKTISSRIRTTTGMCIDTYKWKNGKLNKISTKNI